MKPLISKIFILVFTLLIFCCEQKDEPIKSNFKISNNYAQFVNKMENWDTLNIGVNLSMCMWEEFDKLQITKVNDSIFLQLTEKYIAIDDTTYSFNKVLYQLKNDTLNLQKMMADFDINYQEQTSSPFFVITNPKEKDTILLRTTGLGNLGFNIERYQRIMFELYPKEMEKYRLDYMVPTTEPHLLKETEIKVEQKSQIDKIDNPEQYFINDSLLTKLELELDELTQNSKFDLTTKPRANTHYKTITDTIKIRKFELNEIYSYRSQDNEWVYSAKIRSPEFKFLDSLKIGVKKSTIENILKTELESDLIKIGDLENTSIFIFSFLNDRLKAIDYEGYVD